MLKRSRPAEAAEPYGMRRRACGGGSFAPPFRSAAGLIPQGDDFDRVRRAPRRVGRAASVGFGASGCMPARDVVSKGERGGEGSRSRSRPAATAPLAPGSSFGRARMGMCRGCFPGGSTRASSRPNRRHRGPLACQPARAAPPVRARSPLGVGLPAIPTGGKLASVRAWLRKSPTERAACGALSPQRAASRASSVRVPRRLRSLAAFDVSAGLPHLFPAPAPPHTPLPLPPLPYSRAADARGIGLPAKIGSRRLADFPFTAPQRSAPPL